MLALKKAIAVARRAETPFIESPVRESKSNGLMERMVRSWQGQFRTLKTYFEDQIGKTLGKRPCVGGLVDGVRSRCDHEVQGGGWRKDGVREHHRPQVQT